MSQAFNPHALVSSFRAAGAWVNDDLFSLQTIPGMGWGAVAKRPIPPHTPLFHVPLHYLLTPWTSSLRSRLSDHVWESLSGGWASLILCMMWESSLGDDSKWGGYLANMPSSFDSPMFWSDADRAHLVGTDIEHRIGKEDAETEYHTKIVPVLEAHRDLFPVSSPFFSLESFHIQGSRILSRSFTVPISRAGGPPPDEEGAGPDEDGDEEEEDEVAVMVPMADMLNAAYERDNARLFADGEADDDDDDDEQGQGQAQDFGEGYTMTTTKAIEAGEQVYNTYASPPNSELLRKYGHVDALPLGDEVLSLLTPAELGAWPFGNPGDEVEVAGDAVVRAVAAALGKQSDAQWEESARARVDWWLEEGQDDTFGLGFSDEIDQALVAFTRLLLYDSEWLRAERKGKLPTMTVDAGVLDVVDRVVAVRRAAYPQSIQDDISIITADPPAPLNHRQAAVVRLGEKRILAAVSRVVALERERLATDGKRKAGEDEDKSAKRRK